MQKSQLSKHYILEQISENALRFPNKTAIEFGEQCIPYRELEEVSKQIGSYLRMELGTGQTIMVMMEKSHELVESILGIMKADAIFVPVDPSYPKERIVSMIEEAKSSCMITQKKYEQDAEEIAEQLGGMLNVMYFDEICEHNVADDMEELEYQNANCYIYFTSGTTGKPKGILGRHKSLAQFIEWEIREFGIHADSKVSQLTSPTFDPYLRDTFVPLCAGGTLCIPESMDTILNVRRLVEWIEESKVTLVHMVPSLFKVMSEAIEDNTIFQELQTIILAGEMLHGSDIKRFYQMFGDTVQLVNMYGPSETTLAKVFYRVKAEDIEKLSIPVGKTIEKAQVLLLSEDKLPVRNGNIGEVYIRTPFISAGYCNQPKLTREVFIKNPLNDNPRDIIYKTGDLGKILPDGNLLLVGRVDQQVKIRGHRIEIGDIENQLLLCAGVKNAAVVVKENENETYICAYYEADVSLESDVVKQKLEEVLPEYMIPSFFVPMSSLPMNSNGKIDRKYLSTLDIPVDLQTEYVAPVSDTEKRLLTLWQQILKNENIGIQHKFLEVGGHSLKAVTLASHIYKEFQVEIELKDIFQLETVEAMAQYIEQAERKQYEVIQPVEQFKDYPKGIYPVSSAQKRQYILYQLNPEDVSYNSVKVFEIQGKLDVARLNEVMSVMFERHDILRTSFELMNGEPVQVVNDKVEFSIGEWKEVADLEACIHQEIKPFRLDLAPLLRVSIIQTVENKSYLLLDIHHILCDGAKTALFIEEVGKLYNGETLPRVETQYKDYAVWQYEFQQRDEMKKQEQYWMNVFQEEVPVLNLHTDFKRPLVKSYEGESIRYRLSKEQSERLDAITKDSKATNFITLLSLYTVLLHKYTGQSDIVVGTPTAGGSHAQLDQVIGMFANTLALRTFPSDEKVFLDYLAEVTKHTFEAFENQDYQFEELVEKLGIKRDVSRNPLFDTMLVYQNLDQSSVDTKEMKFVPYKLNATASRFDVILAAYEDNSELVFDFYYCTKLYKRETITRFADHFFEIVNQVIDNPSIKIKDVDMLLEEEKNELIHTFAGEIDPQIVPHNAVELFEAMAEENPNQIASTYVCKNRMELWPSVAEYFIYDDLLYHSMTYDEHRNQSYKIAIEKLVKDKVVVEIGTGADAILSRFCAEAGAKEIYAIEILDKSYEKAKRKIEDLGLTDKIKLIHGDATKVELPELADVCISEIVGAIGGSEGAAVILNKARRLMKEDGVMLPIRTCTNIAAVSLPDYFMDDPYFSEIGADYVEKVFDYTNCRFDLRVCIKNFSMDHLISDTALFEDLDYNDMYADEDYCYDMELTITKKEKLQGFMLWLRLYTLNDEVIDILEHEYCWLPVFVPVFYPGIEVEEGDKIKGVCEGRVSENHINIDYYIRGTLYRQNGEEIPFSYELPHFDKSYQKDTFYQKIFKNNEIIRLEDRPIEMQMSYDTLNKRANQLAHYLQKKGIGSGDFVGLCVETSIEMLVGILGILKTGAAYVPLDPKYPYDRLKYMIEDSGLSFMLTQKKLEDKLAYNHNRCFCLDTDWNSIYHESEANIEVSIDPDSVAYVIYTSGSTGRPKGVLLNHYGLVNLAYAQIKAFGISAGKRVLQFASFGFDASVSEIFTAILSGAELYLCDRNSDNNEPFNLIQFKQLLAEKHIQIVTLPPSMLKNLNGDDYPELETVVSAGEACSTDIVKNWAKNRRFLNAYGPTEGTVCATIYHCTGDEEDTVSIGKAIDNVKVYILDESQNLVPVGVAGELCIGGIGVARGYLNRPELTEERFIKNPYQQGEKWNDRLYRTGDYVRWTEDGNIEYIGRIDQQVKLRGYRIEIGEIEESLQRYAGINEAVVLTKPDQNGELSLCAYLVLDNGESISSSELRNYLLGSLPEYMVPYQYIQIDKMPLTVNGKVDKKALLDYTDSLERETVYVAPRDEVEETIARIWQKVLGVEQIGINDNFFELGGDSIKALQIASKLYDEGLKMDMKDLFQSACIARLSQTVKVLTQSISQEMVTGEVRFTPIQLWFLNQNSEAMHHFNQSVMLYRESGFDEGMLKQLIAVITKHHDALRMVLREEENAYVQRIKEFSEEDAPLEVYNFVDDTTAMIDLNQVIRDKADELQGSINLSEGPLMRMALFKTNQGDHFLIIVHHFIMDGLSWRILFEDFTNGYQQLLNGEKIVFSKKTTSLQEWSEKLNAYANGKEIRKELSYWREQLQHPHIVLPKKETQGVLKVKDEQNIVQVLSVEETEKLLKKAGQAYHTEVNDLLLTALAHAINDWTGERFAAIHLEGHGREEILEDVDISRTVGWFTSAYPIYLELKEKETLGYNIMYVKEQLRKIPNKGIGYGILKYLSDVEMTKDLTFDEPEINFNYLGQFDQDVNTDIFTVSSISTGRTKSQEILHQNSISINCIVVQGALQIAVTFCEQEYNKVTMESFLDSFRTYLQEIIMHCVSKDETEYTPCDYKDHELTIEDLLYIKETNSYGTIDKIFKLTRMQEGMLYHALAEEDSTAYFQQAEFDIHGEFDCDICCASLEKLTNRHDILRANILTDGITAPRMIVQKYKKPYMHYEDISDMDRQNQQVFLDNFKEQDKKNGFALEKDMLYRIAIFKLADESYKLVWSFHHIILDGWSFGVLLKDFFEIFTAMKQKREASLSPVESYELYMDWLNKQDEEEARSYWKDYLQGYDSVITIPGKKQLAEEKEYKQNEVVFEIDEALTKKLQQVAKENKVTLNTMFQAVWGILLQKYNRMDDVVFGTIVSGRPSDIMGIERMAGLFIHNIPVRVSCECDTSFLDLVTSMQKDALQNEANSFLSLAEIQALSNANSSLGDYMMVFENYPIEKEIDASAKKNAIGFSVEKASVYEQTNYDLDLTVVPGNEMKLKISYNEKVYYEESTKNIGHHFVAILNQIVENMDVLVTDLQLLSEEEQINMIQQLSHGKTAYNGEKAFYQMFEEQVLRTPQNIAVSYGENKLTYCELNERANQIARYLRKQGISANDTIGIAAQRSTEMISAVVGVMKAGCVYLPIDPNYPNDRIDYMLRDSGAKLVLTVGDVSLDIQSEVSQIRLDMDMICEEQTENLDIQTTMTDGVYIIYTSGTTGEPKGVSISNQNYSNIVSAWQDEYHLRSYTVRLLQFAAFTFDVFAADLGRTLVNGGMLVLCSDFVRFDPASLYELIAKEQINIFDATPSVIVPFMDYVYENQLDISFMKLLVMGSDACLMEEFKRVVSRFGNQMRILNCYGVTEATIDSSYYEAEPEDMNLLGNTPIGKPMSGVEYYIVDEKLGILPAGVVGELCIGGAGVAKGYLGREELTAEKFIPNPFTKQGYLYRTGDLARWMFDKNGRPDGNVEFLGRADQQLKIRGYRMEAGEIESKLLLYSGIREAAVVAVSDVMGEKYLVAFITTKHEIDLDALRSFLKTMLPEYMVPSRFISLEQMPLTRNGKLDRKALSKKEISDMHVVRRELDGYAPKTTTELRITQIWKDLLGIEAFRMDESFFDLGGHSLKVTTLAGRIHKEFQIKIPLSVLFEHSTVREIAEYIEKARVDAYAKLEKAEIKEYYEQSSAQKRLYLLAQHEESGTSYNIPGVTIINGELNKARVEEVFSELCKRHESLRTSFDFMDGTFVQKIHEEVSFKLEYEEAGMEELSGIIRMFVRKFDLSKAPLIRVKLIRLDKEKYGLLYDMHHIISDGTSMSVLLNEFADIYEGKQLEPIEFQYKDYSEWQRQLFAAGTIKKQEEYWLTMFQGELPVLELPTDYRRPNEKTFEGNRILFDIEEDLYKELQTLRRESETTMYMVLLAAFDVLLYHCSGQEDIVVGTPIAGRSRVEFKQIIGMFVNTLALRNYPEGEKEFSNFLEEVKANAVSAYEHQEYQFEELVEKLDAGKDRARNPLFDVMFVLQNVEEERTINGLSIEPYEMESNVSKFDLTLSAVEQTNGMHCSLEYSTSLFKEETVQRMAEHYVHVLKEIVRNQHVKIGEMNILSEKEQMRLLEEFNSTEVAYQNEATLHGLFEEQAEKMPDKIALLYQNESMTYQELNDKADCIANALRRRGIGRKDIVGMLVERSPEMMIGILGILKSGAAYLPISPEYPDARIQQIVTDSKMSVLLRTKELDASISELDKVLAIEQLFVEELLSEDADKENVDCEEIKMQSSEDVAYVIYTSGSTGTPKGIEVSHKSAVNILTYLQANYPIGGEDTYLLKTPYIFDVSVSELFGWYIGGGKLAILPEGEQRDPLAILQAIEAYKVTHVNFVPALFGAFLECVHEQDSKQLESLKYVILAGEALPIEQVLSFRKTGSKAKLWNLYGPTEATVYATAFDTDNLEPSAMSVPIGKPVSNYKAYVVNKAGKLAPIGVAGELCLAGEGLAKGYLHQEDLTKEKFTENPFEMGTRLYHTGDCVRWLPDGNLEYLGRADNQVKIRGNRIELGEIENVLLSFDAVKEAAVLVKGAGAERYLCAYVVLVQECNPVEMKQYVSERIPEYMVPSRYMVLEEMPLTPSGKINRNMLPEVDESAKVEEEYVAPENDLQEKLVTLFQEVLKVERIGITDSFFELGGNSISATRLLGKIRKLFSVEIPLKQMFQDTSIKALDAYITNARKQSVAQLKKAEKRAYYELSSAQKRMYFLNQRDETGISYNMPGAMKVEGKLDDRKLETAFHTLIERHEALRTSFVSKQGTIVQQIHEKVEFHVEHTKVSADKVDESIRSFVRTFDLSKAPLLRVGVLHVEDMHYLLFDMHHIISDGMSMEILIREFITLYEGNELSALEYQYKDYSEWQNALQTSGQIEKQEEYWLNVFHEEIPLLALPYDYKRNKKSDYKGGKLVFSIGKDLTEGLHRLEKESGSTLYMVLLASIQALLYRYSGQEDIIIGSPAAGRSQEELNDVIGMFVNTLAMRNYPHGDMKFIQFLKEVKEHALDAFENQDYQFEELVNKLNIKNEAGRNPIFDVMFVLQNRDTGSRSINGLSMKPYSMEQTDTNFDLTINAYEGQEEIQFSFEYRTSLFKHETIRRMSQHFCLLLEAVANNKEIKLDEIHLLSLEEEERLLVEFNQSEIDYRKDITLHKFFEEQVAIMPDREALVYNDRSLTYQEVNDRADCVAQLLRAKGVQKNTIVGLFADRSFEMIIGILGILKAGGAYLPISPEYPSERLCHIIKDSGTKLLLLASQNEIEVDLCETIAINQILNADKNENTVLRQEQTEFDSNPEDLAYVIYTSGSTGMPKGTLITHQNAMNLLTFLQREYPVNSNDTWLLKSPFIFDASIPEVFGWYLGGGKLVILPEGEHRNPLSILHAIVDKQVTHINFVPSMFQAMLEYVNEGNCEQMESLKYIVVGGEVLPKDSVLKFKQFNQDTMLINGYGPTECTVYTTTYDTADMSDEMVTIPIGRLVSNAKAYVVDGNNKLVPIGVAGELCVSGDGLGKGYLNREDLTNEKFVENPYEPGQKMYRTGDCVRWLSDGNIEFLGRLDGQVKIRGNRIELGEIENTLLSMDDVKEVAVLAKGSATNKYLCAYIVSDMDEIALDVTAIKNFLSSRLPDYMIPSRFIKMERMPYTTSGKIDRKRLPEVDESMTEIRDYVAPVGHTEKILVDFFQEILKIEEIGATDNFFELGGNSLSATILMAKIHQMFSVEIPLKEIFDTPIIHDLASYIRNASITNFIEIKSIEEQESYRASSAQARMYLLNELEGVGTTYNVPGAVLLQENVDIVKLEQAFQALIERHDSLRTSFIRENGVIKQVVNQNVRFEISNTKGKNVMEGIKEFVQPFDLSKAPLFRAEIFESERGEQYLIYDIHHIISDGVSVEILVREFAQLYAGMNLEPLKLQYKDYAAWLDEMEQTGNLAKQEAYWCKQFAGDVPVLTMPTDFNRPQIQSFEGESFDFVVDKTLTMELRKLEEETGTTMYMILLAAFNTMLYKYTGQEDIVVGTPVAGRQHSDLQNIIGLFMNTLAMRNKPNGEKTFAEFLMEVKENALDAYENQDYPFEELVDQVSATRDISRNPLFDVMFVLNNQQSAFDHVNDLKFQTVQVENHVSKMDITLTAMEHKQEILLELRYCTKLFKQDTMLRMSKHFVQILKSITTDKNCYLKDISMIGEEERKLLSEQMNCEEASMNASILQFIQTQVMAYPDKEAVVYGEQKITYRELDVKSNQLANVLLEQSDKMGLKGQKSFVAILAKPCVELIISIIATWKAGMAYLPIDPELPEKRIAYMLEDSEAAILLSTFNLQVSKNVHVIDVMDEGLYEGSAVQSSIQVEPNDLAYVIYTSGTTGNPKGVMIEHRSLTHYVDWFTNEYKVSSEDKTILLTSASFDLGYTALYSALAKGGTLHLVDKNLYVDAKQLLKYLAENEISFIKLTPSLFRFLVQSEEFTREGKLDALRLTALGGEKINVDDLERFHVMNPHTQCINHYGPSEMTIGCIAHNIDFNQFEQFRSCPVIGKPIAHTNVYVLDQYGNVQPIGIPGEIVISGPGLFRGYWKQDALTKEKISQNPFRKDSCLYHTGDKGRKLSNGEIEFIGRMDQQVKIRGYRIELADIENQVLKHEWISEAIVDIRMDQKKEAYICLYYMSEFDLSASILRSYLQMHLPDYMIPARILKLDKMPLNENGKVDRTALANMDISNISESTSGQEMMLSNNKIEESLLSMWKELLEVEEISIQDNFFALGGHSLKAAMLTAMIRKHFDVDTSLTQIFKMPTIKQLAEYIICMQFNQRSNENPYIVLKESSNKVIFAFPPIIGSGIAYKHLSNYLDDCTLYSFDFIVEEDRIAQYADKMLNLQPTDEFILMGYSAGGNLAFEVAKELERRGRKVAHIILIDSVRRDCIMPRKKDITIGDVKLQVENFLNGYNGMENVSILLDQFDSMVQGLYDNMKIYQEYLDKLVNDDSISSDIHVLMSEKSANEEFDMRWDNATAGKVTLYKGNGEHETMLFSGESVERNAEAINKILGELK